MSDTMKLHGAFSCNELLTHDVDAAKAFYSELLGWTLNTMDANGIEYTIAKVGDTEIAGIMATPEGAQNMPSTWGAYVTVDDVDASVVKAVKLGAKVCKEAEDCADVGRFAIIQDPTGAMLTLVTYKNKD